MYLLCEALEGLCEVDTSTCIVGDFNLPSIDWRHGTCPGKREKVTEESLFLDLCVKMGLAQLVEEPTMPKSCSILDLVLVNDDSISNIRVENASFRTDHSCVRFTISLARNEEWSGADRRVADPEGSTTAIFDYARGDYDVIKLNLSLNNWDTFVEHCADTDGMYGALIENVELLKTLYIPRRRARKPLDVARHVQKLVARVQKESDLNKLERLKRDLRRAVHRQRILEEHRVVNSKNPKTFFRHVNKRLNLTDHLSVLIRDDGSKVTRARLNCYAIILHQCTPPRKLTKGT